MALAFTHRFEPASADEVRTLLLLHGTGGDEHDLVPLGRAILPGAALLSPRGRVLERGLPRFFRRLAEGVFDEDDLRQQTAALADFITAAATTYRREPAQIIAVGFSNGANIAASVLLLRPRTLGDAVLIRAMVPLVPDPRPDLTGTRVLLLSGREDPLVPAEQPERLATLLRAGGAEVTMHWEPSGHQLTTADVAVAAAWVARRGAAGAR